MPSVGEIDRPTSLPMGGAIALKGRDMLSWFEQTRNNRSGGEVEGSNTEYIPLDGPARIQSRESGAAGRYPSGLESAVSGL